MCHCGHNLSENKKITNEELQIDIIQMKHFSDFGGTDTLVCASIDEVLWSFCTEKSVRATKARLYALFKLFP
jgi:hypothetical protein